MCKNYPYYAFDCGIGSFATLILGFIIVVALVELVVRVLIICAVITIVCYTAWLIWTLFFNGKNSTEHEADESYYYIPRRNAHNALSHERSTRRRYTRKRARYSRPRNNQPNKQRANRIRQPINAIVLPRGSRALIVDGEFQSLPRR